MSINVSLNRSSSGVPPAPVSGHAAFPVVTRESLGSVANGTIVQLAKPAFIAEQQMPHHRIGLAMTPGLPVTSPERGNPYTVGERGWVFTGTHDPANVEVAAQKIFEREPAVNSLAWYGTTEAEGIRGGDAYLYEVATPTKGSIGLANAINNGSTSVDRVATTGVTEGGDYFGNWHIAAHGVVDRNGASWRAHPADLLPFDDRRGVAPSTSQVLRPGAHVGSLNSAGFVDNEKVFFGQKATPVGTDLTKALGAAIKAVNDGTDPKYSRMYAVTQAKNGAYELWPLERSLRDGRRSPKDNSQGTEKSARRDSESTKAFVGFGGELFRFEGNRTSASPSRLPEAKHWWKFGR